MLRPSYSELMEVLNNEKDIDMKITSRYTIVIAAAKRARQLVCGDTSLAEAASDKAVSIAINEMALGKINIFISKENAVNAQDENNNADTADIFEQENIGSE